MKKLVVPGLVLAGLIAVTPVAFAQDQDLSCAEALVALNGAQADLDALAQTVPNPTLADLQAAVVEAQADVDAALPPVLTYNSNVYPNNTVPATVAALNEATLRAILADADLGGDARVEVEAALTAVVAHAAAKAELAAAPADAPNPALDEATDKRDAAKKAADEACRGPQGKPGQDAGSDDQGSNDDNSGSDVDGDFDQVDVVPVGGVATGGGPA